MKAVAIWKDHTHIMPDLCPWLAEVHITSLLVDGVEGQIPVAAFVVPDWATYVVQDCLGYWWSFTQAPVEELEGYWCSPECEGETQVHASGLGWWTNKLFNLEK